MSKITNWIFIFLFISIPILEAQTDFSQYPDDTLFHIPPTKFQITINKITSSRAYKMTFVGVPLVIGGLIVKDEDDHFRSLRNDYLPMFRQHYDDYLQYVPAVTMLGMKIGGVKGRSSWGRMLVSDAFSAIIMTGAVNLLKSQANVTRPDGSNKHSFPSGHTATAFMTATMMHKEYGELSPWYSIGAYSVATATGLSRMINNKHWLSDVLVGAGFGILSTELGYYLADLIFKERGINHFATSEKFDRFRNPSSFGIYLGLNVVPGYYNLPNGSKLEFSSGSSAGLEASWFINPYIGIGGRLSAANTSIIINNEAQDGSLDMIACLGGIYYSYPITSHFLVGGKTLAGFSYFPSTHLSYTTIGGEGELSLGTGISSTILVKQNLGVKFFIDYNLTTSPLESCRKWLQVFTFGSSISIMF